MAAVAVGWQVYAYTSSAFDLGIVGLMEFIPTALLVFLGGAPTVGALVMATLLARHAIDRRVGMRMLQAVILFGLATVVFAISHSIWVSTVALAVLGAARYGELRDSYFTRAAGDPG